MTNYSEQNKEVFNKPETKNEDLAKINDNKNRSIEEGIKNLEIAKEKDDHEEEIKENWICMSCDYQTNERKLITSHVNLKHKKM